MRGINEKCAVIGISNHKNFDVSRLVYLGLWSMQHRGQDSSGIASYDGSKIIVHKKSGLVSQVYSEESLGLLKGRVAVGHNRYSTSGGKDDNYNQPYVDEDLGFAFTHNGNLPVTKKLEEYLMSEGLIISGQNDSGLMSLALINEIKKTNSIKEAVKTCWPLFSGAFSCVCMLKDQVFAFRDNFGIRPLAIGKTNHGYVIASETGALDIIGANFVRDVKPGELVVINDDQLISHQLFNGQEKLDAFEFVYLARPDSRLMGKSVYSIRRRLGMALSQYAPVKADVVISVPDSGTPAAVGYAHQSGIPFELGLIKNQYIGRTFIEPEKIRKNSVELKFNVIVEIVAGKDVVLVDDSLVRGNTLKYVVKILREYGAKKVHVRIASPPVIYPDYYGIDTLNTSELIASKYGLEQITKIIDADSLAYLPLPNFLNSIGVDRNKLCLSCFTGDYPIAIT
jgi:amidophosphoribosyltransferase